MRVFNVNVQSVGSRDIPRLSATLSTSFFFGTKVTRAKFECVCEWWTVSNFRAADSPTIVPHRRNPVSNAARVHRLCVCRHCGYQLKPFQRKFFFRTQFFFSAMFCFVKKVLGFKRREQQQQVVFRPGYRLALPSSGNCKLCAFWRKLLHGATGRRTW